jgi:hypothetical protein
MMSNCHGEKLNEVLRAEQAAAETYQRVLAELDPAYAVEELRIIHEHHQSAIDVLCMEIRQMGCEPDRDRRSNSFARAIHSAGRGALPIGALKQGEVSGLLCYEDALHDLFLPVTSQTLIRTKLLPRTRQHITLLDQLLT